MVANPTYMSENEFTDYLAKHNIGDYRKKNDEISFPCPFDITCDGDHKGNEEYHCNFNLTNCTYYCFKCGAKGNYLTLLRHFGDYEEYVEKQKLKKAPTNIQSQTSLEAIVRNIHKKTRVDVREYFNGRGINNASIDRFMLGMGKLGRYRGYIIPIFNRGGEIAYVKIRRMIEDESSETVAEVLKSKNPIPKYVVYPSGSKLVLVGEDQLARSASSDVLICEGELDRIVAIQEGVKVPVVCGGGGAQTFKEEWIDALKNMRNIYICLDRDKAGDDGFKNLASKIAERIPTASIYKITLPFDDDSHADLTDYFLEKRGIAGELFVKYAEYYCGAEPIDPTKFKEMTIDDVAKILDLTIKHDYANKVITFLAMLTTYTELDQLNIMFSARSATGKSHITIEVSNLFPEQDVKKYGIISATAMFYNEDFEKKDEETGKSYIDLERKILILVEMPDPEFMERLRALLSHDDKVIKFAITNKGKGGRNCSNDRYLLGFPSVFFCSANMKIDEQEQTRCIILSPESTQEKIRASVDVAFLKGSDEGKYRAMVENDPDRNLLKDRILYLKSLNIGAIKVPDMNYLESRFLEDKTVLKPEDSRRSKQLTGLVKAIALLNAPFSLRSTNHQLFISNPS